MLGKTLGHYRILDRLGAGGMGVVWLAEDLQLGRKVALKTLREELVAAGAKRGARFEREARAVAALNHPNIVTLHSIEEAEGIRFLTMEYVEGRRLDHLIPERGMAALELLRIGAAIADALGAAHEIGIVHRDLKPGNILLTRDGRVKVLDFGLARTLSEVPMLSGRPRDTSLTQEGVAMGTLNYMSPEQLQGKGIDHRTDLFSLGVVLFEMATGALPFSGDSAALVISSVLRDPAPRIDERGSRLSPLRAYSSRRPRAFRPRRTVGGRPLCRRRAQPGSAPGSSPAERCSWWRSSPWLSPCAAARPPARRVAPRRAQWAQARSSRRSPSCRSPTSRAIPTSSSTA